MPQVHLLAGSATERQKGARGQLGGFLPNELGLLEKQVFLGGRGMSGDNDNSVAKGELNRSEPVFFLFRFWVSV